jgi:hypothetical protein
MMKLTCAKPSGLQDEGRAYLQEQLAAMQVPFVPAAANFVMVNVGDGCAVFQKLLQRKIIVRPLKGYGLPEWVRISVGTMEENRQVDRGADGNHAFALVGTPARRAEPSVHSAVFGNRAVALQFEFKRMTASDTSPLSRRRR